MGKVKIESVITGFWWKMLLLDLMIVAVFMISTKTEVFMLQMILLFAAFIPMVLIVFMGRRGRNLYYRRSVRFNENEVRWWGLFRFNRVRMDKVKKFRCEMVYYTENTEKSLDGGASAVQLSFEMTGVLGLSKRKKINDVLNVSQLDIKHGDFNESVPLVDIYRFLEEKYPQKADGMLNMR